MIDLHGLTKVEALRVTRARLSMTQDGLRSGNVNPNSGNNRDHIFKIIAGAGNHSAKGAVLKPAINRMLKDNDYEHYADLNHGVFLVRLRKWVNEYDLSDDQVEVEHSLEVMKDRRNCLQLAS